MQNRLYPGHRNMNTLCQTICRQSHGFHEFLLQYLTNCWCFNTSHYNHPFQNSMIINYLNISQIPAIKSKTYSILDIYPNAIFTFSVSLSAKLFIMNLLYTQQVYMSSDPNFSSFHLYPLSTIPYSLLPILYSLIPNSNFIFSYQNFLVLFETRTNLGVFSRICMSFEHKFKTIIIATESMTISIRKILQLL